MFIFQQLIFRGKLLGLGRVHFIGTPFFVVGETGRFGWELHDKWTPKKPSTLAKCLSGGKNTCFWVVKSWVPAAHNNNNNNDNNDNNNSSSSSSHNQGRTKQEYEKNTTSTHSSTTNPTNPCLCFQGSYLAFQDHLTHTLGDRMARGMCTFQQDFAMILAAKWWNLKEWVQEVGDIFRTYSY